jgi:hypothetical protein
MTVVTPIWLMCTGGDLLLDRDVVLDSERRLNIPGRLLAKPLRLAPPREAAA